MFFAICSIGKNRILFHPEKDHRLERSGEKRPIQRDAGIVLKYLHAPLCIAAADIVPVMYYKRFFIFVPVLRVK